MSSLYLKDFVDTGDNGKESSCQQYRLSDSFTVRPFDKETQSFKIKPDDSIFDEVLLLADILEKIQF